MPVVPDILRTWRDPRAVIRSRLSDGVREDRALATVMGACALMFVAQWPRLARESYFDASIPLEARLGGALLGVVFLLPLALYLIAAASHVVARVFGGKGSWFSARLALFWALLAVTPALMFHGLLQGFLGQTGATRVVGGLVLLSFLYLWIRMLIEAES